MEAIELMMVFFGVLDMDRSIHPKPETKGLPLKLRFKSNWADSKTSLTFKFVSPALGIVALFAPIFVHSAQQSLSLENHLNGSWTLRSLTCNGKRQNLPMNYRMIFHGKHGEYFSQNSECTQVELEEYQYLAPHRVAIKQGLRVCHPNPCSADLPASECGKVTNQNTPVFEVEFRNQRRTMVLRTDDPNSIDCSAEGQKKPAIFEFSRDR